MRHSEDFPKPDWSRQGNLWSQGKPRNSLRTRLREWVADPLHPNHVESFSTAITAAFTGILTVVAIGQVWLIISSQDDTRNLLQTFNRQAAALQQAADQAKRSADAAGRQAEAAKDYAGAAAKQATALLAQSRAAQEQTRTSAASLAISEQNLQMTREYFQREQRPWVTAVTPTITDLNSKGKVTIRGGNIGKTPAFSVHGYIGYRTYRTGTPFHPEYRPKADSSVAVVFPNGGVELSIALEKLSDTMLADVHNGRERLYVYCRIEYFDLQNQRHQTDHCSQYDVPKKQFVYCDSYNSAN